MKRFIALFLAALISACGGGSSSSPAPVALHAGMPQVNISQTSMVVMLGFDHDLLLGFLPVDKVIHLADVAKVCVDSYTIGWGDNSTRCVVPDSGAVAVVENTPVNDCFQVHLKLKDGTIAWSDIDNLVMTGRPVTKFVAAASAVCLQYGTVPTPTPTPVPVPVPTPVPTPNPSPFHAGMPQVNIGQNSMTVTLGFSGELILGFLPATKETRLVDVAKVCVDSDNLGWADYSTRCVAPDSSGVAIVTNTETSDCFQLHLKLKDGSIVWGNIDNLMMTGRPAMKTVLTGGTQCLHY